ncbi:MAG TPA: cell division protein FtsA [Bacteroidales bacterium]|nr:cell division protein FtsA [Bacteroidales bacterium]
MESSEIIVGLDIGTTKIAAIVGRKSQFGKIEILGHGTAESIGVKRGVVINIDNTIESIKAAVREAETTSGVNIKCVNVGIAGQHIKSIQHRGSIIRNSSDSVITQEDINRLIDDMYRLVMQPGEEIVHVIPQEYIVDKETGIKKPIGMAGVSLEANFHIITGLVTAVRNIYRCVDKAGLEIVDQVLEPLASADAVLIDDEKEAGVVLVDIGGGTTDIAIFQDDIIRHTAVIPLGGDIVTEDIREGCTIIKKHAEKLKVNYGSALAKESRSDEFVSIPGLHGRPPREISLRNLAGIIQARMEEILEYVYNEIRSSGFERKLIAGIVLTGGGAQLKNIVQLTEFITGMDARIGYPNQYLADNVPEAMALPMYATGVGLVIKGLEKQKKVTDTPTVKEEPIQTHSGKTKGSFFDSLFKKGRQFFDDDVN